MMVRYTLYLLIIIVNNCSSSTLLDTLRKHKTIAFQSRLSSPVQFSVDEGSKFRLTCSFLSNFDKVDIYWYHNRTLIESFVSKTISEEEDDDVDQSFLVVTIQSTIEIEKTHLDMNGIYQCVGVHTDAYDEQIFNVHVVPKENSPIKTNLAKEALVTVHTYQALFEPRSHTSLMCRSGGNQKDKCVTEWFNPENEPLTTLDEYSDLVLKDANFEDNMGLYTCQICCHGQCQILTSFVYPAGLDN